MGCLPGARALAVAGLALVLAAASCDAEVADPTTTAASTSTSVVSTTGVTTALTTEPSTTVAPVPACDGDLALAQASAAIALARLAEGDAWLAATTDSPFVERTVSGDEFADRLGLDCSLLADQFTAGEGARLLLVAWTGPRMAFVIQATDPPTTPYASEAIVTILTEDPTGEFLTDDRSVWAAELEGGETLVLGHVDYNLGATAKSWQTAVPVPPSEEPTLDAERAAVAALEAIGARNVGIAQPSEFGSEEGTVMFVSAAGQIGVVDVAPAGTFDPLMPRYYSGPTTMLTVGEVDLRLTEPDPDDLVARAGELGWACGAYVWIMEPPFNGSVGEMVEVATALIDAGDC